MKAACARLVLSAVLGVGCSSPDRAGGKRDAAEGEPASRGQAAVGDGDDAEGAAGGRGLDPRGAPDDEPSPGEGEDGLVAEGGLAAAAMAELLPGPLPDVGFPEGTRSLRLRRSIAVRALPHPDAKRYGTVARDTRVTWRSATEADGCDGRWIEIQPRGWVCDKYLEPSHRGPVGVELPRLEHGELVPGTFGKVIGEDTATVRLEEDQLVPGRPVTGSYMVRQFGEYVRPGTGKSYWRISEREPELLLASRIREYRPSQWQGSRLGDDTGLTLPIGFPLSRKNVSFSVAAYRTPDGKGAAGKVKGRAAIPVLETAVDAEGRPTAHRVGEAMWLRAGEVRVAALTEPPPLTEPDERWIDIDLDEQVLVAYEGASPVYVTLVSTGSRKHPTETGIYRIWVKFFETDMSDLGGESPYSVATVPWTQFYAKDLALHTAYWHDTFGTPRSHGCTNLSPVDARFLYFWTRPGVPPGWTMANGIVEAPGSLIRVRSKDDPQPEFKGYAKRVYDARLARQSPPAN